MFKVNMRGKLPETYRLYLLGDIHEGRVGVAYNKLDQAIEMIRKDRHGYAVMMGDAIEAIFIGDKRYSPNEQGGGKYKTINTQCADIAEHFKPVSEKILCWLNGNHEEKVAEIVDASRLICETLGGKIPHGGRSAKITISDNIKIWVTHGAGFLNLSAGDPRQRETNEQIAIKRKLRGLYGDCVLMAMGHIHKLRIEKPFDRLALVGDDIKQVYPKMLKDSTGFIHEDYRFYCSTGSFVRGYVEGVTTYVEKAMFAPTELGMIKATITKDVMTNVEKIIL